MNKNLKPKNTRHRSREYAVQALYQWQFSQLEVNELLVSFAKDHDFRQVDNDYWQELVMQSIQQVEILNAKIQPFLSRPLDAVNPVELAILRIAFYELCHRLDIPYSVIINEAVELAKIYGAVDSHRFINGVLDAASKELRSTEVALKKKKKFQ